MLSPNEISMTRRAFDLAIGETKKLIRLAQYDFSKGKKTLEEFHKTVDTLNKRIDHLDYLCVQLTTPPVFYDDERYWRT